MGDDLPQERSLMIPVKHRQAVALPKAQLAGSVAK